MVNANNAYLNGVWEHNAQARVTQHKHAPTSSRKQLCDVAGLSSIYGGTTYINMFGSPSGSGLWKRQHP